MDTLTITLSVISIISLAILYYIIKSAVKNGIIAAIETSNTSIPASIKPYSLMTPIEQLEFDYRRGNIHESEYERKKKLLSQ